MPIYLNNESHTPTEVLSEDMLLAVFDVYCKEENLPLRAEVDLTLVDDAEMQELNRTYRQKDATTDVLSFPMYENFEAIDDEPEILLGDIVISVPRAVSQGEEFGHGTKRELLYLLVHGLLHLAGYDHMDAEEKKVMRIKEERILQTLGVQR